MVHFDNVGGKLIAKGGELAGFAVAGADRKFIWADAKIVVETVVVSSAKVKEPVAVRYAWAASPMGNLKIHGRPDQPLHSFRTDAWDLPEPDDPAQAGVSRAQNRRLELESIKYCEHRRMEEAKRALEILERLEMLGRKK